MRLVKVLFRGKWYSYLTNVLDPLVLPAECVVALYDQRWHIEDAFNVVKRRLLPYRLAQRPPGSALGHLAALYPDLTDAVAEALHRSFKEVSLEMVFRGLYHFAQAHHKALADDPVDYFARKAKDLTQTPQETLISH